MKVTRLKRDLKLLEDWFEDRAEGRMDDQVAGSGKRNATEV